QVLGLPRARRGAVLLYGQVDHGEGDVPRGTAGRQAVDLRCDLEDPQGQVAHALELRQDPHHRHHEAEAAGDRGLTIEQLVAALQQRQVHGIDLVVGTERLVHQVQIARPQGVAHQLQVLVDAHTHQLDVQLQLVELRL